MPDLSGLPALDLAIGLAFIYLVLSLFCSAVQELIASALGLRAGTLERGLRNMLASDAQPPPTASVPEPAENAPARALVTELYAHPLMRSAYKSGWWPAKRSSHGRLPSYISPRSFALALVDTLAPGALAPADDGSVPASHDALAAVRSEVSGLAIPAGAKHALLTLLDDARGDVDAFRQRLEAWFDDTMARVSGWYKRKTQLILCLLALLVTVGLNANSLVMGERLWKDPAVRAAVVQQAASAAADGQGDQGSQSARDRLTAAADDVDAVAKLGVPLGWSSDGTDPRHVSVTSAADIAKVLGGWLLTITALSLGAPFWFDTLSRLSRLRGSGKPETPLPASGRGQLNERVVTETPPLNVTVTMPTGPTGT